MNDTKWYAIAVKLEPRIAGLPTHFQAGRILDIIGALSIGGLLGLQVYGFLGGGFPFPDLTWSFIM